MSVEDKYTDADLEAGKLGSALFTAGQQVTIARALITVDAADDDDSVFRAFKDIPSSLVPLKMSIKNSANAGSTDWDVGIYKTDKGAVISKDLLANGLSMAGARAIDTENNLGLNDVALADGTKDLSELSGQSEPDSSYDIAFTANTIGGAGTILVTLLLAYK